MGGEIEVREVLPPAQIVERGREQASLLADIVEKAGLAIDIAGRKYLRFEAWQTLGAFGGITPYVVETKEVRDKDGNLIGYEARAEARGGDQVLSAAEAMCTREEDNWKDKPLWQIRSMAQTRACAKALRNVLAWVVVLAGYEPTPAEEMEPESGGGPTNVTEGEVVDIVHKYDSINKVHHWWIKVNRDIIYTQNKGWVEIAYKAKESKTPIIVEWEKKGKKKILKYIKELEAAQE